MGRRGEELRAEGGSDEGGVLHEMTQGSVRDSWEGGGLEVAEITSVNDCDGVVLERERVEAGN